MSDLHARIVCSVLSAASIASSAANASTVPRVRIRDTAAFIISDPPPTPLDLYEKALRFTPGSPAGASTGAYTHPGFEYGVVVSGAIARWDGGRVRVIPSGESFASPPGLVSASVALRSAVQLSAYLTPRGKFPMIPTQTHGRLKAAPVVAVIFQNRFSVLEVPPTPFTFVEELIDVQPGASTVRFSYGGQAYFTVANGDFMLEKRARWLRYRLGERFVAQPGETLRFANMGKNLASIHVAVLLPESTHLTQPPRAY